jgi:uncharacterized membrane protein (UPF0127 family)
MMGGRFSRRQLAVILVLFVILILLSGLRHVQNTSAVQLASKTYNLEIANTDTAREKGLGDRSSMPANHGMLFSYRRAGQQCFWMKNMRFSLDMIWLDSAYKVVKVMPNITPQTYPTGYCAVAQYVIELNAGQAAQANLRLGQSAYGL